MIEQYLQIKNEHKDCILFFRLGDFYEMFFEDAEVASRELEIVLTGRDGGQEKRVPMCGIPYHAADHYIARLISRGYRIAICEQVEDPRAAKGIVKREVVRILTPGTVMDDKILEENRNNYLAAVIPDQECIGIAYIDISTGDFWVTEIAGMQRDMLLESELNRIAPVEILVQREQSLDVEWTLPLTVTENRMIHAWSEELMSLDHAVNILLNQFQIATLEAYGLKEYTAGVKAAAAIISYLNETQKSSLKQIQTLKVYNTESYLDLDYHTRRNLELCTTMRDGKKEGSLLSVLDSCGTAMGKRLLRKWIEQPLKEQPEIERRLDAVQELKENLGCRSELKKVLGSVYDLERLSGKLGSGTANPRDLLALKVSISMLGQLKSVLQDVQSDILRATVQLDELHDLFHLINESIDGDAPISVKEGGIIKNGYRADIDELKQLSEKGSTWLMDFESREKERTGLKSLKVGFNKVFGYYIEVSKNNLHKVPGDYVRRQTLVNTERYICEELKNYEEKILGARERLFALEYEAFTQIKEQLSEHIHRIQETARQVARVDVLYSLAETAYRQDYIRPLITENGVVDIKAGRHPVVEQTLTETRFVPNDIRIDQEGQNFAIITGPNMGGKSTYMRQTALLVLMAQIGSFIPAESAKIGIVDKIFTRVGASDDLAAGQSTFMVEMVEVANILNNATAQSLIILDEIGRGTSTYDGMSIARAVSEHIVEKIGARTLFATHYHEITDLADQYPQVMNLSVSVYERADTVVFLKKVLPGKADKSYGIHVARLAGLPPQLIERAGEVLDGLEKIQPAFKEEHLINQPSLFAPDNPVISELEELDIDELTPREAINLLFRWKEIIK